MQIEEFEQQNTVFGEYQSEYLPVPAYMQPDDPQGAVICCWKLTPEEVAKIVETGVIWQHVLTFNAPLQPQMLSTDNPFVDKCDAA